jgi:hypothetical protein
LCNEFQSQNIRKIRDRNISIQQLFDCIELTSAEKNYLEIASQQADIGLQTLFFTHLKFLKQPWKSTPKLLLGQHNQAISILPALNVQPGY